MARISPVLRSAEDGGLLFWCPGCGMPHQVKHGEGPGPRWASNGDAARPTLQPSVLVRYAHWVPPATMPEVCEQIRRGEIVQTKVEDTCHSFVTDGRIQFLGDCTHALAGQTVDLPAWGDDE